MNYYSKYVPPVFKADVAPAAAAIIAAPHAIESFTNVAAHGIFSFTNIDHTLIARGNGYCANGAAEIFI